jgi:predicted acetyltransferase
MSRAVTSRALTASEYPTALALWQSVFSETPGYFERYYRAEADPYFREGDTLGAWVGGLLVSTVHICRRPVFWDGGVLLCGGIANVATLPEFRRQGLSRRLLEQALEKMQREAFDFSLLGTGVPAHYEALDWEQIRAPRFTIQPSAALVPSGLPWRVVAEWATLAALYASAPRPAQFERPVTYWDHWAVWNLHRASAQLCELPGRGYLLATGDSPETLRVLEWRAVDAAAERDLLEIAAARAAQHRQVLSLNALPHHLDSGFPPSLGEVTQHEEHGDMLRKINIPESGYQTLLAVYHSGAAAKWMADGF